MKVSLGSYVKEQCPQLEICQTFVNASKHAALRKPSMEGFVTIVGSGNFPFINSDDDKLTIAEIYLETLEYRGVIHVKKEGMCESYELDDLIGDVYDFWHTLIYHHGIG